MPHSGCFPVWREFEDRKTAEALFAASLDALQPLSNHLISGLAEDSDEIPSVATVLNRKRHVAEGSQVLWQVAQQLIDQSAKRGLYK